MNDPMAVDTQGSPGERYFLAGDYERAAEAVRAEIAAHPDRGASFALLGMALIRQGKDDDALAAFTQALRLDPSCEGAHRELGNIYVSRGAYEQAMQEALQELAQHPAQAGSFMLMGRILHQQGKFDEALEAFARVLEIDPLASGVHRAMGDIYFGRGEHEKAATAARREIEITPDQASSHALWGRVLARQGKHDEALEAFTRALALDPRNPDVWRELVETYVSRGDLDQAMKAVSRALELMPQDAALHALSGRLSRRFGRQDDAMRRFSEALRLDPSCADVHAELADMHCVRGEYAMAVDEARREVKSAPGKAQSHALLGRMLTHQQGHDEALAAFSRALALDPSCVGAHHGIADILYARGDYGRAEEEIRREIALAPATASAHVLLGRVLLRRKKEDEALAVFAAASSIDPESMVVRDEIGNIYFTRGEFEKVIAEALSGLSRRPGNTHSYEMLVQGYFALKPHERSLETMETIINLTRGDPGMLKKILPRIIDLIRYCNQVASSEKALALLAILDPVAHLFTDKEKNQLLCEQEIARGCSAPQSRAGRMSVQVTNKCNLRCLMCAVVREKPHEISPRVRDEIIAMMPYLREINWLGGEVFLYPDFDMLLSEGIKYAVRQGIVTNGLLLTEPMIAKIIANNVSLNFSIDGTTPEVYERIRRGARFGDLLEKLALFNRVRDALRPDYQTGMTMVVMRSNYHQMADYVRFAHAQRFERIEYQYMVSPNEDNEEDIFTFRREDAILAAIENGLTEAQRLCSSLGVQFKSNITPDMLRRREAGPGSGNSEPAGAPRAEAAPPEQAEGVPASCAATGENVPGARQEPSDHPSGSPRFCRCFAPWRNVYVDFFGAVTPQAHCVCNNVIGNLNTESMEEIWKGDRAVRYRELLLSGAIEKICPLHDMYGRIPYEVLDDF